MLQAWTKLSSFFSIKDYYFNDIIQFLLIWETCLLIKQTSTLHSKMLRTKFGRNWLISSGGECLLFNFVIVFSLFCDYRLFERDPFLRLDKLESPLYPECYVRFQIGWNLLSASGFVINFKCIFTTLVLSALKKRTRLFIWKKKTWIPFTQGYFEL